MNSIEVTMRVTPNLTVEEAWADGEPETWTVEDLAEEIRTRHLSFDEFVRDWNLTTGVVVKITDSKGNSAEVAW